MSYNQKKARIKKVDSTLYRLIDPDTQSFLPYRVKECLDCFYLIQTFNNKIIYFPFGLLKSKSD